VSRDGADFWDPVLAAYTGTCGSLTESACNDDGPLGERHSVLNLCGLAAGTYYLAVEGYQGSTGAFRIRADKLPRVGDLVINELMIDPSGTVTDNAGEWVELYNGSGCALDLNGYALLDNSSFHTINQSGGLVVAADDYLVIGRSSDTTMNGG